MRVLITSDVDGDSANYLAERFVSNSIFVDAIVACGPFVGVSHDWSNTPENQAIAQADIASVIATLEQIQCRVIYLPTSLDPPLSFVSQLHLTPNSINIHARKLNLKDHLFIAGFTESNENLLPVEDFENMDDDVDLSGVEVNRGITSIQIIEDMVNSSSSPDDQ
jgi:Icc-related predicted phosphoesterase